MTAGEVADVEIPILDISDTCDKAMSFMDECKLSHYPVVSENLFVGLVYEEDLFEFDDWSQSLSESKVRLPKISVNENSHFLSVVKLLNSSKISVVPVTDEKDIYKGVITNTQVVRVFGDSSIVSDLGGVIEIEMVPSDYSMQEISRVIESTNVKILGSYVRSVEENKLVVTLKLNKEEVELTINTLHRFGYKLYASYNLRSEKNVDHDRYENLMHILNL